MIYEIRPDLLKDWKVLVVDDESDSLLVVQTLLEMCGATVFNAGNGKAGLEIAQQKRPHVIISDLSMSGLTGWQMMCQIKMIPTLESIPVIALTAHAMVGDRQRAMEAGFHNYLTKPLRPHTFINDLLRLLTDVPELARKLK